MEAKTRECASSGCRAILVLGKRTKGFFEAPGSSYKLAFLHEQTQLRTTLYQNLLNVTKNLRGSTS